MYLVPILFVLPDIPTLLGVASGQPMPLLYKIVTGSPGGGFGLLFLIIGIGFFAGIGALTAACKFSFRSHCSQYSNAAHSSMHMGIFPRRGDPLFWCLVACKQPLWTPHLGPRSIYDSRLSSRVLVPRVKRRFVPFHPTVPSTHSNVIL